MIRFLTKSAIFRPNLWCKKCLRATFTNSHRNYYQNRPNVFKFRKLYTGLAVFGFGSSGYYLWNRKNLVYTVEAKFDAKSIQNVVKSYMAKPVTGKF